MRAASGTGSKRTGTTGPATATGRATGITDLLVAIAAALLLGAGLAYWTQGAGHAWLHLLYLPVLLAVVQRARTRNQALAASESRLRALVRNASDIILLVRDDGAIDYASPSIRGLLGLSAADIAGRPITALAYPADAPVLADLMRAGDRTTEVRLGHVDGSWRHVALVVADRRADPAVGSFVINVRDMTEQRAIQAQLQYLAMHDPLTGLANRTMLLRHLTGALSASTSTAYVLTVNVDRLKRVNEAYGHRAGDHLLTAVGQRLQEHVRHDDVVGRYSGSGLVLVTTRTPDVAAAIRLGDRLRGAVGEPFQIGEEEVYVTATVGIAARRVGHDADTMIGESYAALRYGKETGGNRTVVYDPSLRHGQASWARTDSALHRALRRNELHAHFQPIMRSPQHAVVGFEALVRWQHPTLGEVSPSEFIPVAEETGLIGELGAQILEQACTWLALQHRRHGTAARLWVSVNTSAQQLADPRWPCLVEEAVVTRGLPPECLTIEITESSIMTQPERSVAVLEQLRTIGVRVAVDDFGTGYSSLGVLRDLPIDVLKIDRAFVRGLGDDHNNAIVSAIVGLARSLRLTTVAEGVETEAQRRCLDDLGCDFQQGFLFSKAVPPAQIDLSEMAVRSRSTQLV